MPWQSFRDDSVVDHVMSNAAPWFSQLLKGDTKKTLTKMMGDLIKDYRGTGYGQKVHWCFVCIQASRIYRQDELQMLCLLLDSYRQQYLIPFTCTYAT